MTMTKHPETLAGRLPYLVQRLRRREFPSSTAKGVDQHFSMDYMGSSEFEWGALPAALRALRAALPTPKPVKITATRDGVTVSGWYVGDPADLDVATYWFTTIVATDDGAYKFHMKEVPRLYDSYGPDTIVPPKGSRMKPRRNYAKEIVGWWCVDGDGRTSNWALFREEGDANNWVRGIEG